MKKKQAWKVMGAVLAGTLVFSDAVPLRASASAGTEKSAVQNETVWNGERYRDKTGSRLCESENRR